MCREGSYWQENIIEMASRYENNCWRDLYLSKFTRQGGGRGWGPPQQEMERLHVLSKYNVATISLPRLFSHAAAADRGIPASGNPSMLGPSNNARTPKRMNNPAPKVSTRLSVRCF